MNDIICVYHKMDLDGKCSAAIIKKKYPNCILVPYNYGDSFDYDLCKNKKVIMVDCSLQPFQLMIKLSNICDLTWIDHHKTGIEEYNNVKNNFPNIFKHMNLEAFLDNGSAGCELSWNWAFPDKKLPKAVFLLGRYDVWDLKADVDVENFQCGMKLCEALPEDDLWNDLFENKNNILENIVKDGCLIKQYIQQHNKQLAKSSFETEFDGLYCICLNSPGGNSHMFDSVYNPLHHQAMLVYYNTGKHWTVSLYSTRPDVDVGNFAKQHGGGGHKNAAGFQLKKLPKILMPRE